MTANPPRTRRWTAARGGTVRRGPTAVALVVAVLTVIVLPFSSAAAAQGTVHVAVAVNGRPAATTSDSRPAQIHPDRPTQIRVAVVNATGSTVDVATVRFEGSVLDLPLFSYDSAVDLVVAPRSSKSITFPIDMTGVGGLATGLIVATVTLIGPGGDAIASQSVVTKVHGSLVSIYGLFALAVLVLTVSSLALAVFMLVRHRLPQNRWLRGVRFFVPGFGIGLVLTFTLAASGLAAPGPGHWLPLLVVPSVVGLAAGLLTPAPDEEEFDDYDENVLLAEIVMVDEDPLEAQPGSRVTAGAAGAAGARVTADSRVTAGAAGAAGAARATGPLSDVPDGRATIVP